MSLIARSTFRCALALSALTFASGCGSSVDPLGPAVNVSLMIMTPAAASATLHADIGSRSVSLHVPEGSIQRVDADVRGTGYGDVPVHFTLTGISGETLASASFSQSLQPGYRYGIGAVVGSVRLLSLCTTTAAAVP